MNTSPSRLDFIDLVPDRIAGAGPGSAVFVSAAEPEPISVELWRGHPIQWRRRDGFANMTLMGKPYGKRPIDFLRLVTTIRYQDELAKDLGLEVRELTQRFNGGATVGTWGHPDLAFEYARWLEIAFGLFCNRVMRRLLSGDGLPPELSGLLGPKGVYGSMTDNGERRLGFVPGYYTRRKINQKQALELHKAQQSLRLIIPLGQEPPVVTESFPLPRQSQGSDGDAGGITL